MPSLFYFLLVIPFELLLLLLLLLVPPLYPPHSLPLSSLPSARYSEPNRFTLKMGLSKSQRIILLLIIDSVFFLLEISVGKLGVGELDMT